MKYNSQTKEYRKRYYQANKQKILEYVRKYKRTHKAIVNQAQKRYADKHREYYRAYCKKYYADRKLSELREGGVG